MNASIIKYAKSKCRCCKYYVPNIITIDQAGQGQRNIEQNLELELPPESDDDFHCLLEVSKMSQRVRA